MRFANAEVLWLLLIALPALSGFLWWAWRKKRRLIGQFVQSRLLANLTSGVSTRRQKIRLTLLVATVGLILLVLARPQWGFEWEEAKQRGLDIVIAIDTSRSMLAEDVAPNRLARAKLAALDLKKLARTDRLGLVAFAGSAFLQCPLSLDDEAFRQSVNALDVNIIPQGGTVLAEAIRTAQSAFKEKTDNHKILILFTDGEDHDGQAVEAARDAAKEGLRIITVGVGTPSGELLRTTDASRRVSFLKDDQGNAVKSRLNEKLLREIAQATGEIYVPLTGANTMELIYERRLAPLPKAEFNVQRVRRFHERYQWFLALAILGLIFEMFLPERKSVRRTEEILAATTNAELRKAVALLFLILLPSIAGASPAKALQQYDAGKFGAALREYQRLLQDKPADPRLHYNAGAAAFAAKDYDKALKHFQSALLAPDLQLQQSAFYNLGNSQFRSGEEQSEPPQKQQSWEEAMTSYESALKLNPKDADAEYNLELTKKKLEELKKQQEEQQKDQNSKDDKKDDKKDQSSKQDQKKDQKKDDKKDQKSEDQKSKSDQNQQDQKPDQKQDSQKPDPGKEQKKPDQKDQTSPQPGEKPDEEEGQPQSASLGKMTRRQAQQLLDAQKDEEKAMIFIPQIRTNRADRVFKDW